MPGVEVERASSETTQISLLAYYQDDTRKSWNNHHDQHELEDKALALALARVGDNTIALDKALQLAVSGVTESQDALREVLEGRIAALTTLLEARDKVNETRIEDTRRELENLTAAQHEALVQRFDDTVGAGLSNLQLQVDGVKLSLANAIDQLDRHSRERDEADRSLTFARIDALIDSTATARVSVERVSDTRLALLEQLARAALEAHKREHEMEQKAIEIAKQGQDDKLESMNEFRTQLREQAANFPTRDYVDSLIHPVVERVGVIEQLRASAITRDQLDTRFAASAEQTTAFAKTNDTRIGSLERAQNIAYGIMLVLVFAIPIGLKFIP